jgi:hypothetical protein
LELPTKKPKNKSDLRKDRKKIWEKYRMSIVENASIWPRTTDASVAGMSASYEENRTK